MDARDVADLPTRTESIITKSPPDDSALGIFWLCPEERFDELSSGVVLGRSRSCELRLDSMGVSRQHARVALEGPVWMLRDLGSKNGVSVNGHPVKEARLSLQDTLRVSEWVGVVCRMPRAAVQTQRFFDELLPGIQLSAPTLAELANLRPWAAADVAIIVQGATGTGKELVARAIHEQSGRRGAFVALNCAAIPEGLAEAELFGRKRGAFTGAIESAAGQIEGAAGGSLFLDEIAELPPAIQSKLLRVLEERSVMPLGATKAIRVDFRLIAACQTPLEALVKRGTFRADLHARLLGARLELPALKERRQEVLRLLCHALGRRGVPVPRIDSQALEQLCSYHWPYNVRELHQLASVLAACQLANVEVSDLPQRFRGRRDAAPAASSTDVERSQSRRQTWVARYAGELQRLRRALAESNGNVSEAARAAGIPRHLARRLLEAEAELSKARGGPAASAR